MATWSNSSRNSSTEAEFNLLIDGTYFLLIDSTYKLNIQDAMASTWSNASRN